MSTPDADDLATLLSALSPEEQAIIRPVLERDLEFQRREKQRITSIKSLVEAPKQPSRLELTVPGGGSKGNLYSNSSGGGGRGGGGGGKAQELAAREASALSSHSDLQLSGTFRRVLLYSPPSSPISPLGRVCNECGMKLGVVFNSGIRCRKCSQLLCDGCRVYTDREKTTPALCPKCFQQREVLAASGEWTGAGGEEQVSATLLRHLRRESDTPRVASKSPQRCPESFRTRNMSLPPIPSCHLLGVPNEARPQSEGTNKFWGGSPSPRSPHGPTSLGLPGLHPREPIGSPVPRPLTPSQPRAGRGFVQDGNELGEEEDVMPSPPASSSLSSSTDPSRHRRQSWQHSTRSRYETRRQSEQIPRIFI